MTDKDLGDIALTAVTLYREARGESREAKLAIAYVIATRAARPCWWGKDVAGVIAHPWQFTSMTDPSDPQLTTWPRTSDDAAWLDCLAAARMALANEHPNPMPGADSYYDVSIEEPFWAKAAVHIGDLGRLRFFKVMK